MSASESREGTGSTNRLIKKYPNRRLYDTRTSSYITLSDVKELVLENAEFQVVDAKTGEDLTRSILLQIIIEEESEGVPMFTSDLLSQMIRFYGNAMQGMMGKYLEGNIKAFTYMTWDWSQMNRFADPVLYERYRNELMHPIYQHSAPYDELRWHLDLER